MDTYRRNRKGKTEIVRKKKRKKLKIPLLPLVLAGAGTTGFVAGYKKLSPEATTKLGVGVAISAGLVPLYLMGKYAYDHRNDRKNQYG